MARSLTSGLTFHNPLYRSGVPQNRKGQPGGGRVPRSSKRIPDFQKGLMKSMSGGSQPFGLKQSPLNVKIPKTSGARIGRKLIP